MTISEKIAEYVKRQPYGGVFTHKQLVKRFGGHGPLISQSLKKLKEAELIAPLERGLWQRPKPTRFGPAFATPEKIVSVLAKERKAFVVPSGAKTLNEFGASTQMPMKPVFISTKRIQPIKLGKAQIEFKYSQDFEHAVKHLSGLSKDEKETAARLWVALEYAGKEHAEREGNVFKKVYLSLSEKGQKKLISALEGKLKWAQPILE